jgi:hypothetical protein
MERGSRKHVLDWTEQSRFLVELLEMLQPVDCRVTDTSQWMPLGRRAAKEARLNHFGPQVLPGVDWRALSSWWLKHSGNTPNWDIALSCEIEGRPGLVLVEAKANVQELSKDGKKAEDEATERSNANHNQIGLAIEEARKAVESQLPGVCISRDKHFQLSNRIAFGWRLATMGVPTVLLYLGFTGDEGIRAPGREPFANDVHWQAVFRDYLKGVCPTAILDAPLLIASEKLWVLSRSRDVLEPSPPVEKDIFPGPRGN